MKYYVLCGNNGIMILENCSFPYAQKNLNRYCKGDRRVYKAASLKEAQGVVDSHVAAISPWKKAPVDLQPGNFVKIREFEQNSNWKPHGSVSSSAT